MIPAASLLRFVQQLRALACALSLALARRVCADSPKSRLYVVMLKLLTNRCAVV